MNIEKLDNGFMEGMKNDYPSSHNVEELVGTSVASMNCHSKKQDELLDILKKVKKVMDSDDYCEDFDRLYDIVSKAIEKYDNQ